MNHVETITSFSFCKRHGFEEEKSTHTLTVSLDLFDNGHKYVTFGLNDGCDQDYWINVSLDYFSILDLIGQLERGVEGVNATCSNYYCITDTYLPDENTDHVEVWMYDNNIRFQSTVYAHDGSDDYSTCFIGLESHHIPDLIGLLKDYVKTGITKNTIKRFKHLRAVYLFNGCDESFFENYAKDCELAISHVQEIENESIKVRIKELANTYTDADLYQRVIEYIAEV